MATVPKPRDINVTSKTIEFATLVNMADGGVEQPYDVYLGFGGGRKRFMSNRQGSGVYGKPTTTVNGQVVHLPDPDLTSTNP